MSVRSTIRTLWTLGKGTFTGLSEPTAGADPLALFGEWFDAARRSGILLPEAMTVATTTGEGVPSARMMLLKGFDDRGFVFYSHYESRKSQELIQNPKAALVFHWSVLQRQVRIEGSVQRIPTEESAAYFRTRHRGSQIGAWASKQSAVLADRGQLEERFRKYEQQFKNGEVPLPALWGGFRLAPTCIEFWQGRVNRLHDRLQYNRQGDSWTVERLYP